MTLCAPWGPKPAGRSRHLFARVQPPGTQAKRSNPVAGITRDEIQKVARLSRLALSEEDVARYADQLSAILNYAEALNGLDTTDVEPTSHSLSMTNVFRDDVPHVCLTPEEVLANAPEAEAGCFRVPTIIQG